MGARPRYLDVLDSILAQTRAAGERSVAMARVVLTFLLIVRMATTGVSLHTHRGQISGAVFLVSMVFSFVIDRLLSRPGPGRHTSIVGASVAADAILVGSALGALVAWPYAGYTGLIHSPSVAFVLMAIVGSALRFSVPLVVLSIATNGAVLAGLLSYEVFGEHRPFDTEPMLTIFILFATVAALSLAMVTRGRQLMIDGSNSVLDRERVARHLGTYVSPAVAERALSGDELALGGQRQPVVCLFSDLRGFTLYSESIAPEQLVSELNAYLEAMVAAAESEGGIIDKFIGDAIMVVFGTGTPQPDDAARAILTARAMQRALVKHNTERSTNGLPPLAQGIGIHAGVAIVGNIGTTTHMQHTVMGSVVNVASRLEAATKELDVPVVISGAVVDAAREGGAKLPGLRAMTPVRVRGVAEPLPIYSFATDGTRPSLMDIVG